MGGENPGLIVTILAFVLTIGTLVFVHEMGHYLAGRWFGVHAERFSIGFGKELFGWTDRRGTRWKVAALPLGGYVQFAGDMDASSRPAAEWEAMPAAERARTFPAKPLWQRAIIVAAGPAINFLFAILLIAGFLLVYGQAVTPTRVEGIEASSPAARMGLTDGDVITRFAGQKVDSFEEMASEIAMRPGEAVTVEVERDGATRTLSGAVGERFEEDRFGNRYRIGLMGIPWPKPETRPVSLIEAPIIATAKTVDIVRMIVTTLGQVVTGRRPIEELGGPLKIAQVSGEQLNAGIPAFIAFIALISINLGFINLLPIPMLDGGHLLLYAIEAIRQRPASPDTQEWAFRAGFALVVGFMLLVTFNDLSSFGLFRSQP